MSDVHHYAISQPLSVVIFKHLFIIYFYMDPYYIVRYHEAIALYTYIVNTKIFTFFRRYPSIPLFSVLPTLSRRQRNVLELFPIIFDSLGCFPSFPLWLAAIFFCLCFFLFCPCEFLSDNKGAHSTYNIHMKQKVYYEFFDIVYVRILPFDLYR